MSELGSIVLEACGKETLAEALKHACSRTHGDDQMGSAIDAVLKFFKDKLPEKGDPVMVRDRHSSLYGKAGTVSFVKDGLVYVSIAEPRSIAGSRTEAFPSGKLEILPTDHEEREAARNLSEKRMLAKLATENVALTENLTSTQERCTSLLLKARSMRNKIMELGGEDPGIP